MNKNTLTVIQTASQIGKILSKIVEVCCIIGTIGCAIGIASLAFGNFDSFKIGGVTVHSMIEASAEMSIGTLVTTMAVAMIFCICEGNIARRAWGYFRNELAAGTPFTLAGAKELLRLGIAMIIISIVALSLVQGTYAALNQYYDNIADMHLEKNNQITMGLIFIGLSFICKYGAERELQLKEAMNKDLPDDIGNNSDTNE